VLCSGVTQTINKLVISCLPNSCTDADILFTAQTAATAGYEQIKTQGSASVK
jgi:hypothetical protein